MPDQIRTSRLVLRPFTAADGPRVVALLNDFEVTKWLAKVPYPFTQDDLRLKMDDGGSRWPDLAAISLAGDVIGAISSGKHLGYWLGRDYWGHGYASEAAAAMVRYCFDDLGRNDIGSAYFTGNAASGRILQRLGFHEVARNMQLCRARGVEVSSVDMTLSRADWVAAT